MESSVPEHMGLPWNLWNLIYTILGQHEHASTINALSPSEQYTKALQTPSSLIQVFPGMGP